MQVGNINNIRINHSNNPVNLTSKQDFIFSKLGTSNYLETKDGIPEKGAGTCEWFLGHPSYHQWQQQQSSSLLLVSADPGCGKSVLTRHLIDQAIEQDREDRDALGNRRVCYYFFKNDNQDQLSAAGALRCLLHQLLGLDNRLLFTQEVVNLFEQYGDRVFDSIGLLWEIFAKVALSSGARGVICFLDALDEGNKQDCTTLLGYVARFYQSGDRHRAKLKLFLSGRPYKYIREPLPLSTDGAYHIEGHNTATMGAIAREIDAYIYVKVESMTSLSPGYKRTLINEILQVENRTYLWVGLVFKLLEQEDWPGPAEITAYTSISRLPRNVNEAYERILNRSLNRDEARRLLQIVLAAKKPLTLGEMASALATKDHINRYDELRIMGENIFEGYVRELCGFFVTIVNNKVFLLHQTASEFLTRRLAADSPPAHDLRWEGSISLRDGHGLLARISMRYLELCQTPYFESYERFRHEGLQVTPGPHAQSQWMNLRNGTPCVAPVRPNEHARRAHFHCSTILTGDFFHYCATNWYIHARKADTPADGLMLRLCGMQEKRPLLSMWSRTLVPKPEDKISIEWETTSPLAVAAFCNLENAAQAILMSDGSDPLSPLTDILKARCGESATQALSFAAALNWKNMVELLLNAVRGGAFLLLEADDAVTSSTKVFLRQCQRLWPDFDPLHHCVKHGHDEIVQMLLQAGARPRTPRTDFGPSLILAMSGVSGAKVKTLQMLLDYGADLYLRDRHWETALHHAAKRGDHACVEALLRKGDFADAPDVHGVLPLHLAAGAGSLPCVELLVGATTGGINVFDAARHTPLYYALQSSSCNPLTGFLEKLLELGANVHVIDENGEMPLHKVVRYENRAALSLFLFKASSDPNSANDDGDFPLHIAIGSSSSDIVSLLLEADANPNVRNRDQDAPLHHAAYFAKGNKMDAIIDLLLKKGARANARNADGKTPLHLWASEGSVQAVSLLLDHGADLTCFDAAGNTPLHCAARGTEESARHIGRLLLERGASVHAETNSGQTPLHLWASSTSAAGEDIVQQLLLKGADPNAVDRAMRTPFAYCTSPNIAEILLANGADLVPEEPF